MCRPALPPIRPSGPGRFLVMAGAILGFSAFPGPAAPAELGRWTPPDSVYQMPGEAIHMALLPGDGGGQFHSRIIWWQASTIGGEWGWVPGDADCSRNPVHSVLTPLGSASA